MSAEAQWRVAYELGREDARRQIAEALRKRAEAFGSYDARDALLEFAEDIHDRRVGPWAPVPSEPPAEIRPAQVWVCGAAHADRQCTSRNPHRSRVCGWRVAEHQREKP